MSPKLCWQPQKKKLQTNQNIHKSLQTQMKWQYKKNNTNTFKQKPIQVSSFEL
jgi:hypothetical protein